MPRKPAALCERYACRPWAALARGPGRWTPGARLHALHFVAHELRTGGAGGQFIETGEPVARQTRPLGAAGLPALPPSGSRHPPKARSPCQLLTTGPVAMMQAAAQRWLNLLATLPERVSALMGKRPLAQVLYALTAIFWSTISWCT